MMRLPEGQKSLKDTFSHYTGMWQTDFQARDDGKGRACTSHRAGNNSCKCCVRASCWRLCNHFVISAAVECRRARCWYRCDMWFHRASRLAVIGRSQPVLFPVQSRQLVAVPQTGAVQPASSLVSFVSQLKHGRLITCSIWIWIIIAKLQRILRQSI